MGKKHMKDLTDRRLELIEMQNNIIRELVDKSIDPIRTHHLLTELQQATAEHRELLRAIDVAIEQSRKSWWSRNLQGS